MLRFQKFPVFLLSVNGGVYIIPHYCVYDCYHHHREAPVLEVDLKNFFPVPSQSEGSIRTVSCDFFTCKLNHFSACTGKTVTTYRYKWNVTYTQKTVTYRSSSSYQVSKVTKKDLAGSKGTLECCTLVVIFDSGSPMS